MSLSLFHPLGIYIFGLGGGFLLPLLYRFGPRWLSLGFVSAMAGLTLCAVLPAVTVLSTGEAIDVHTAGALPPVSINLRFGAWEAAVSASATLAAAVLAVALWREMRSSYVPQLLFLLATMGVNGLIQTRDLFNLFVFLEILSVATYGLLALSTSRAGSQAAFKYVAVTMVASAFVLLGAVLLYEATGHLNIDLLIAAAPPLGTGVAGIGLAMVLAGFLIELKPYPAGGWGLDVYENAPPPLAAFLSVVGSAGLFFAVVKLLPLYSPATGILTALASVTFLASNLAGLRQTIVFRMLGYSSIGQIALLLLALGVLTEIGAEDVMPFILFGLFLNHLLAKAGLFCLADAIGARTTGEPLSLAQRPALVVLLGIFVVAICGLPPFPGFWAKWELIMQLAEYERLVLIAVILTASLLEAVYLFRWFFRALGSSATGPGAPFRISAWIAPVCFAVCLAIGGAWGAVISGASTLAVVIPVAAGAVLMLTEPWPGRVKACLMLAVVVAGWLMMPDPAGIPGLFAPMLLFGGLVIAFGGLAWSGARHGHYPLVALLLLSIQGLLAAQTGVEFYVLWEFVTLASAFLIVRRVEAWADALRFLVFSLAAAFCLVAGFAILADMTGTRMIYAVSMLDGGGGLGVGLLAAGFLIKAAAIGFHVWLPGAYGSASDDVTALFSAVVSKAAVFGLMLTGYLVLRSGVDLEFGYGLAWIGMATVVVGAVLALQQTSLKLLLAYSSMSQLGYVVLAVGLMGHLGWVSALYLVASHMMVKGILFLALAGIRHSTGVKDIGRGGRGLMRSMPVTATMVGIALLAMSGLPPLTGFGAKWLLLSAMMEKEWYALVTVGVVATGLGLWYMARFFAAVFLGPGATEAKHGEVSGFLLLPQVVLVGGILVLSLYPKLLMEPVSQAIAPEFAATLVWQGQSLETIYGLWDPFPVMLGTISILSMLAILWWSVARLRRPHRSLRRVFQSGTPVPQILSPPLAIWFWSGVDRIVVQSADRVRSLYSGDARTYVLQAILYFLCVTALLALVAT